MSNRTPSDIAMWKAVLKDGKIATEENCSWIEVQGSVQQLSMIWRGVEYNLPPNLKEYVHFKTGSCSMSGGRVSVESRSIGGRLKDDTMLVMRFKEDGSSVSLETGE